jgi:hypothetical protein
LISISIILLEKKDKFGSIPLSIVVISMVVLIQAEFGFASLRFYKQLTEGHLSRVDLSKVVPNMPCARAVIDIIKKDNKKKTTKQ